MGEEWLKNERGLEGWRENCWPRMLPWHFLGSGKRALPQGCESWIRPKRSELLLSLLLARTLGRNGWGWGSPQTHQLGDRSPSWDSGAVTRRHAQPSPFSESSQPRASRGQGSRQADEVLVHWRCPWLQAPTPHPSGGPEIGSQALYTSFRGGPSE